MPRKPGTQPKEKKVESRIYSYGAKAPEPECLKNVNDQIYAAHHYMNDLIMVEVRRREAWNKVLLDMHPEVKQLFDEWNDLNNQFDNNMAELRKLRASKRSRVEDPNAETNKQLKVRKKEVYDQYKQARKEALTDPAVQEAQKAVDDKSKQEVRDHRAGLKGKLYWGTYLTVEDAMQASRRGPKSGPHRPPMPRRFNGRGKVAVQLQGGLSPEDLLDCQDTRLRVQVIKGTSPDRPLCYLWMRIGSNAEDRTPIWAKVKFRMHRPLPPSCQIKWCYLKRDRVATKDHWYVQFVISSENPLDFKKSVASSGTVGVDIGYRRVPDGLRVAYWSGSDGKHGSLVMSEDWLGASVQVQDLMSIRSKNFDTIMIPFKAWLKSLADSSMPEWMLKRVETVAAWRSPSRLASFVIHWRDHRIEGDDEIFVRLEGWRRQDKHLYLWQEHLRRWIIAHRVSRYRVFARELAVAYHTVAVEDINLAQLAELPADDEDAEDGAIREYRHQAALSGLVSALSQSGMTVVKVDAKNTTRDCSSCGHTNDFDNPENLFQTCSKCGKQWDQDLNAAQNLRDRGGKQKPPSAAA